MKSRVVLLLCLSLAALWAAAPPSARTDALRIDPLADGIVLGGGILSAAGSEYLVQTRPAPPLEAPDIGLVNAFDRLAILPYSGGLDTASTILQYATLAVPALFAALVPFDQLVAIGVVYGEALSYAYLAKNLMKYVFPRYRPFVYQGSEAPGVAASDWYASFPSGHTVMAFTAATFSVFVFATYFPSSDWLIPFGTLCYGLAGLTASFRVVSGMHFLTDVAVGSVLGFAFGYFVPLLHRVRQADDGANGLSFEVSADGVALVLRL